jgi:hypothetical protein
MAERKPLLVTCAKDLLDCLHEVHTVAESLVSFSPLPVDENTINCSSIMRECGTRLKYAASAMTACEGPVIATLSDSVTGLVCLLSLSLFESLPYYSIESISLPESHYFLFFSSSPLPVYLCVCV